jgi:hypothetical protein
MIEEKCSVCGHERILHTSQELPFPYCMKCPAPSGVPGDNAWHDFKLDNLQLVEDLAKERNLI